MTRKVYKFALRNEAHKRIQYLADLTRLPKTTLLDMMIMSFRHPMEPPTPTTIKSLNSLNNPSKPPAGDQFGVDPDTLLLLDD